MNTALFDTSNDTKWFITDTGEVYAVNRFGRKWTKTVTVHKRGYVYVRTTNGNYQLHRLVASAFLPNPQNKPTVNHIDGNKQNNHVSNLEWATYKENATHAIKHGLTKQMKKNDGNVKYSIEECRKVLSLIKNGTPYRSAGKTVGMPYSTVAHLVRGSRRSI